MIGAIFGTPAVTVPNFITVATQVVAKLPVDSQVTILPQLGGLADALQEPGEQVRISDGTLRRARELLAQIVAMPEARPHIRGLRRFREAWGIDAPKPEPKPKPPRKPIRLPRPLRPSWEGDDRYDQERSRRSGRPYRKGTLYAALDRRRIVNA